MKKKLAIFDLDGTLFNTNRVNYMAYDRALSEQGHSMDYDFFCKECNGKHYTVFLPGIIGENQKIMEIVHERKKRLYASFLQYAEPNTHLIAIMHALKEEYYVTVATTASRSNTEEILKYFDIYNVFDLILTQEDAMKSKPSPEIFEKAVDFFEILPENTVIFEDSEVGIKAAKQIGCSVFRIVQ